MGFDLEYMCCNPPSSSSSTANIFCNENYNKCSPCCCNSCCRQPLLNDHTYSILKRICHKIIKSYNRQQCREKYTVFDGGNSINSRWSDWQRDGSELRQSNGDVEAEYNKDGSRRNDRFDARALSRNKRGEQNEEFDSSNNIYKRKEQIERDKIKLAGMSSKERVYAEKNKKGKDHGKDEKDDYIKAGKGQGDTRGRKDADDSDPQKKSKKPGSGGKDNKISDNARGVKDADENDTSKKSRKSGTGGKNAKKDADDSDTAKKSKKAGSGKDDKVNDNTRGKKDADENDTSKKSRKSGTSGKNDNTRGKKDFDESDLSKKKKPGTGEKDDKLDSSKSGKGKGKGDKNSRISEDLGEADKKGKGKKGKNAPDGKGETAKNKNDGQSESDKKKIGRSSKRRGSSINANGRDAKSSSGRGKLDGDKDHKYKTKRRGDRSLTESELGRTSRRSGQKLKNRKSGRSLSRENSRSRVRKDIKGSKFMQNERASRNDFYSRRPCRGDEIRTCDILRVHLEKRDLSRCIPCQHDVCGRCIPNCMPCQPVIC